MTRSILIAVITPYLLLVVGCAQTRTYEVAVRNATDEPLIVWLTKEGGPAEPVWASPEQVAANVPVEEDQSLPWSQVPPGKTASTGPVRGKFHRDARAVLRVYREVPTINDLLAIGRNSPSRVDVVLRPGRSGYVVTEQQGQLVANRVDTAP